ncbi:MAG: ATP-binding protein [Ruminococcus sp.]|nr:ATP-binding protein [Ruminococcus sp.]
MDNEIYEKVYAILSQRRAKAIAENDMRIKEINSRIPEIKEINDALYNTGKELIKIITEAKGADVTAKIERIKQNNLGAQQVAAQLLTSHGYPADYLDIRYTCPKCSDTGYIGGINCSCLNSLLARLNTLKLNEKAQLTLSNFNTFSLSYYQGADYEAMERILNYARNYAANFSRESDSILIFGNTGLGKTHISLAIANEVLQKGFSVIYDSTMNILRDIEKEHFSHEKSTEILDLVCNTDLLILDDLGTEFESKFYNSAVYNVINSRLIKGLPTIINTNMDFAALSTRYGGKVASRITTMYTCLEFKGDDVRLQKKYKRVQNK